MPRKAKSKAVTGNGVVRAYSKAIKRLCADPVVSSAAVSAGLIIPPGQTEGEQIGIQVFVMACTFSQKRLKTVPNSGGLYIYGNKR